MAISNDGNAGVPGYSPSVGDSYNPAGGGGGLINKANYAQLWQMVTGTTINGQTAELNPTGLNFQIAAGGKYKGPFAVTYDSAADEFVVGATRDAAAQDTDIVTSGLDIIELTMKETIARGANTNGYIYYSMTGQGGTPFFNITLNINNGGTIPAQTTAIAQVLLARYFHNGTTVSVLRQLQFGNIKFPGRW